MLSLQPMQEPREQATRPLLILLLLLIFLFVLSAIPTHVTDPLGLKRMKPLSDLKPDARYVKRKGHVAYPASSGVGGLSSLISRKDSLAPDSVFYSFSPLQHALKDFFLALNSKRKVRIAYFGDSMIEGDLLTQTIRELYQKKYGGAGVGLVPLTSPVAGFRQSVVHSFSDNWKENNILSYNGKGLAPGISGHVFFPPSDMDTGHASYASATFRPGRGYGNGTFHLAKVLLTPGRTSQWVSVHPSGQAPLELKTGEQDMMQFLSVELNGQKGPVQFRFGGGGDFPVYGISFESDTGVYLDNLGFRGNSGMPMTKIPASLLGATDDLLDYDLVILHYGINAVSATVTDYSWYTRALLRTILHFRKAMPGTPVLLIGTADKGYNSPEGTITDPGVPRVVEAQKKAAKQAQAAFVDLFALMGGEGSMVRWVESPAPLANKDYTHFNFSGAARIGKLIFECLEKEKAILEKDKKTL